MVSAAEIVHAIESADAPEGMRAKVIAVDGPGGAGKSTFAAYLAELLGGVPIIRTDDFASWNNPLSWYPRLIEQVLEPLSRNQPAQYQRYDWSSKRFEEWHRVEPIGFLVLKGVSASREAFRPYLTFTIWIETPREERLRRGLQRDGAEAREQWEKGMAEEDDYIAREHPQEQASLVIRGMGD